MSTPQFPKAAAASSRRADSAERYRRLIIAEAEAAQVPGADGPPAARTARNRHVRMICLTVRQMCEELLSVAGAGPSHGRDRRRSMAHVRQIAMYVCHVVLGFTLTEVGLAFGRDRTTVGYACQVVEDRRDDRGFDDFVSALERVAQRLVASEGGEDRG